MTKLRQMLFFTALQAAIAPPFALEFDNDPSHRSCGRRPAKCIGWMKANRDFVCVCGQRLTFEPDQFKDEIAKAERMLAERKKAFSSLCSNHSPSRSISGENCSPSFAD
jgi:hypothetical protein